MDRTSPDAIGPFTKRRCENKHETGFNCLLGQGTGVDIARGLNLMRAAAAAGHSDAQRSLEDDAHKFDD